MSERSNSELRPALSKQCTDYINNIFHFYQAAVAVKRSNLLICFCRFDLSCPTLEKDSFIENLYIVLSH